MKSPVYMLGQIRQALHGSIILPPVAIQARLTEQAPPGLVGSMVRENEIRDGEIAVEPPIARDAGLQFIGRISTPWTHRRLCPRQGRQDGPVCRIELFEPWVAALEGIERYSHLEILYWLGLSRRDLVMQSPANDGTVRGTFALRSPVRPNPIGTSIVIQAGREGSALLVRGLDCLNGTPLLDIKPDRRDFMPLAPPQPGDFEIGDGKDGPAGKT